MFGANNKDWILQEDCCTKKEKWDFLQNFPSKRIPFLVEQTVYLLKIKITYIFDFCLLWQNQDLKQNCENLIQE